MPILAASKMSKRHVGRPLAAGLCAISRGAMFVTALALFVAALSTRPAYALDCPVAHPSATRTALEQTKEEIQELSKVLAAHGTAAVPDIVARVRLRFPNATGAEVTNYMLALYCPVINEDAALSEATKRSLMFKFSSRMTRELMNDSR